MQMWDIFVYLVLVALVWQTLEDVWYNVYLLGVGKRDAIYKQGKEKKKEEEEEDGVVK